MTNKSVAQICALAAIVALPTLSWAGTESAASGSTKGSASSSGSSKAKSKSASAVVAAPEKLQESAISGDIGINVVTAYYSRGVIQSKHSASFQPYADLNFKAFEGDGFLNKAVFSLGIWESFTNNPGSTATTKNWYESDLNPTLALTFGKVTLTESYLMYFSPSDSFGDFHGLNSKISYDDADILGALALHPSLTLLKELSGKAGSGTKKGEYWELAVTPGFSAGAVAVTLPIALGTGSGNFYTKDGYGYTSAGLNLSYTLPVAKSFGAWTANIGGTYYNLKKSAVGGASTNDVVGSAGVAVAF
jgi:hypothetical protein